MWTHICQGGVLRANNRQFLPSSAFSVLLKSVNNYSYYWFKRRFLAFSIRLWLHNVLSPHNVASFLQVNWKFCAQWGLRGLFYWTGMLAVNDDELLWPGLGSWRTSQYSPCSSSHCLLPPYFLRGSHPYLKLEGKFMSVLHANVPVVW